MVPPNEPAVWGIVDSIVISISANQFRNPVLNQHVIRQNSPDLPSDQNDQQPEFAGVGRISGGVIPSGDLT